MARKKHSGGGKKKKIPVFATAGALITGYSLYNDYKLAKNDTTFANKAEGMAYYAFGYDSKTNTWAKPGNLVKTLAPAAIGVGVSMAASKMNANRYISKVPFFSW